MQIDQPANDIGEEEPRKTKRTKTAQGGGDWLFASWFFALAWIGGIGAAGYFTFIGVELTTAIVPTLVLFATAAVVPPVVFFFVGLAAREAARARFMSDRVAAIAAQASSSKAAAAAINASRALKGEVAALNQIVGEAGHRLSQFQGALSQDGNALATALARDIQAMRAARIDMRNEAEGLSAAVGQNVKTLRDATAYLKHEAGAAQQVFAQQIGAFDQSFSSIGARSAEFAAAAANSGEAANTFDHAVGQALEALAHATSLTDSARKAALQTAEAANGAARAVLDSTQRAVTEARHAARTIRAESGRPLPEDEALTGTHAPENMIPPTTLSNVFDLLRLKPHVPPAPANDTGPKAKPQRKAKKVEQAADEEWLLTTQAEAAPQPAPRKPREANLADVARLAGVSAAEALSANDLVRIAGAVDLETRRETVRRIAAQPVRQISTALRRNREMRQAAELLRRNPARALGQGSDRTLTSAYLLVDAALG
jgi:hypothetical protein